MGLASLVVSILLASLAGARVAHRLGLRDRAEALLGGFVVTSGLLGAVLYGLGLVHQLRTFTGAGAVSIASLVVIVAGASRADFAAALRGVVGWLTLPGRVTGIAAREGSATLLLVPVAALFLVSMTAQAILLAPLRGFEEHEALVAFAVQARGLGGAAGPGAMPLLDARPQLGELFLAWVGGAAGHGLIDVPSVLVAAPLVLATASLARACSGDAIAGAAWALALLWLPAVAGALQTTNVDLFAASFVLAGAAFAARPLSGARSWLAAVACALGILTSPSALVPSITIVALLLLRALAGRRWSLTAIAIAPIAALAAVYGRNTARFGRPIVGELVTECGARRAHVTLTAWLDGALATTSPHGMAVAWVIAPSFLIVCLGLVGIASRAWLGLALRRPAWTPSASATAAMTSAIAALVCLSRSPDLGASAPNVIGVGLAIGAVAWIGARWRRLGREVAVAAALASVVSFAWQARFWAGGGGRVVLTASELGLVSALPERELVAAPSIDAKLSPAVGSQLVMVQAQARERTLGPGSVVAFTVDATRTAYALYTFRYENSIVYVPAGPNYVERVKASNATWVYASGAERDALLASGFADLGPIVSGDPGLLLRRTTW